MAFADVGTGHADFRAQGPQMEDLFLGHLVGDHQDQAIALLGGDQRQAQAGVARRCLDQGSAGLEAAVALRRLDHGKRDAVLDGAAGVLILKFEEEAARSRF